MCSKIYIIGPVGSGKTTLARKLSKDFGFDCCELDRIVYELDPTSRVGNRKRSEEERDRMINMVLLKDRWIVEDAGRAYFEIALQKADSIIQLEPSISIRRQRILLRWIKQNLHLEKCGYAPNIQMLKCMFKWTLNYENGSDGVKERLMPYKHKISIIRTKEDIDKYINKFLRK